MLPEQQQRILGYFIEEAKDHLNTIQQGLLNLQSTIDDQEMVNEVFRAAHSVKGGAAMLGIHSIQKTSHRLEDYFKELKERPIKVDQKLENLFLRVFDTLQLLLDHLQGPFGLSEDVGENIMSDVEPVFNELKQHLDWLGNQGRQPSKAKPSELPALNVADFGQEVMAVLREMLQLFKPPSWPNSRQELQECCNRLIALGEKFNLPNWINLLRMCEGALANAEHSHTTLAPVVIKEIKAAQELVLAGRANEISASAQLQVLQPIIPEPEPAAAISDDEFDDLFSIGSEPESTIDEPLAAQIELSEPFDFSGGLDTDYSDFSSVTSQFWETEEAQPHQQKVFSNFDSSTTAHPAKTADPTGPEVGAAELNTLADLFETDLELDATWQEEEILTDAAVEPAPQLVNERDGDEENEFADLFEDVSSEERSFESGEFDDDLSLFDEEMFAEERSPAPITHHLQFDRLDAEDAEDDFADLFDDITEKPAESARSKAEDPLGLFDEDIFGEDSDPAPRGEGLYDIDDESEVVDLFEEVPNTRAATNLEEDDALGLFDEALSSEDGWAESGDADEFNLTVNEDEDRPSAIASSEGADNLSELFAGLDENDLSWQEFPQESSVNSQSEVYDEQVSEQLLTESTDGWNAEWSDADLTGLTVTQDFQTEVQAGGYEEENLEFEFEGLDFSIDEDAETVQPNAVKSEVSNAQIESNDESDLFNLEATEMDWGAETSSEEREDLADLTDDFDTSLFAESQELDFDIGAERSLAVDSPIASSGKQQAAGASSASKNQGQVSRQELSAADSLDDFFSLDRETTTEFWGETFEEPDLGVGNSGLDEGFFSTEVDSEGDLKILPSQLPDYEDIFADNSGETFWNLDVEADTSASSLLDDFDSDGNIDLFGGSGSGDTSLNMAAPALTNDRSDLSTQLDWDSFGDRNDETTAQFDDYNNQSLLLEDSGLNDLDASFDENWGLAAETPTTNQTGLESWETAEDNFPDDLFANPFDAPQSSTPNEEEDFSFNTFDSAGDLNILSADDAELETSEQEPELTLTPEASVAENWLEWETSESENLEYGGLENEYSFDETLADTEMAFAEETSDLEAGLFTDVAAELDIDFAGVTQAEELTDGWNETDFQLDGEWESDLTSPPLVAASAPLNIGAEDSPEDETLAWLEDDLFNDDDNGESVKQNVRESEPEDDDFLDLFANSDPEDGDFSLELEGSESSAESLDLESSFDFGDADLTAEGMDLDFVAASSLMPETANDKALGGTEEVDGNDGLFDDFAELEALLDREKPIANTVVSSSPAPANLSGGDEFAELEALLSSDPLLSPKSPTTARASVTPPISSGGVEKGKKPDDEFADLERMILEVDKPAGGASASKSRSSPIMPNKRSARSWFEQTMKVPVKHMDNLSNLVGELVVNRNTLEQDQERLRQCLDNLLNQVQQLSDVGARMQDLYERSLLEASLLASRKNYRAALMSSSSDGGTIGHQTGADYDPLEMDRFTSFHTLSQEMIELIVRVRESTSDIEFVSDETDQVCRQFRQVSTQLQEGLTRARMVPFGEIERVFPLMRHVRDKAAESGKQAEIRIEGRETLIDKLILEHFSDPLKHLVNNAIAHGIETPEVRQRAGKPATGRITIRAFHQGNQTVISFSDDGAGIDVERVKAKAVQKGLMTAAEAKAMSRHDAYQLIYHPNFSTKDEADLLAGRGIGMDVVLTSLSEIRGSITTDSNTGKGTTFTIRLPLTLSICKALCCISDKARIAFPMDGVEDALDIEKERIQINAEGNPCITWRDMVLPFRPLSELLAYNRQLGRGSVYGGTKEEDTISIVVLRSAGNFIALQVDRVLGEQEIVIKQLEGPIPKPLGVAGATVLGDGRIMPIGDVLELIDLSLGRISIDTNPVWTRDPGQVEDHKVMEQPTVLIVDDSITVRELLSMTFNKAGYRVEQARDGQEAWDKLRSGLPCQIVFCDIEMPRMDGLELLARLQKDPDLNHLPVAMLTSRGAEKHRQMAVERGARGYFTKPYLEEALLDAASRMLKGEVLVTSSSNA
ncbi:response regulator [Aerosakkonema funiforme]|uniref:hybrid sensor histidine kinase/response regulator n=1 Tax=Aerosakkonema funiforme TaxID=1246630 RepID=UPI0035B9F6F4